MLQGLQGYSVTEVECFSGTKIQCDMGIVLEGTSVIGVQCYTYRQVFSTGRKWSIVFSSLKQVKEEGKKQDRIFHSSEVNFEPAIMKPAFFLFSRNNFFHCAQLRNFAPRSGGVSLVIFTVVIIERDNVSP